MAENINVANINVGLNPEEMKGKKVIVIIFGTRPEILKLFVLYRILKKSDEFYPLLYNTAQQKISGDILQNIGIHPDLTSTEKPNRSSDLNELIAHLLGDFNEKFSDKSAVTKSMLHGIIVQGDTASAFSGALWGFLNQIPVFHA